MIFRRLIGLAFDNHCLTKRKTIELTFHLLNAWCAAVEVVDTAEESDFIEGVPFEETGMVAEPKHPTRVPSIGFGDRTAFDMPDRGPPVVGEIAGVFVVRPGRREGGVPCFVGKGPATEGILHFRK